MTAMYNRNAMFHVSFATTLCRAWPWKIAAILDFTHNAMSKVLFCDITLLVILVAETLL